MVRAVVVVPSGVAACARPPALARQLPPGPLYKFVSLLLRPSPIDSSSPPEGLPSFIAFSVSFHLDEARNLPGTSS